MKAKFLLFAGVAVFSLNAFAQFDKANTKKECTRRCNIGMPNEPEIKSPHDTFLAAILEKKRVEKDPEKLKQLAADEANERERFAQDVEKRCTRVCRHNPDE